MNLSEMPITPIQQLSEKINNNNIFIKRDDLLPVSFGGNKVRKSILFFKDLEEKLFDCVVTYGSSSSNHCRIVANIAVSKNLPCYIVSPIEENVPTSNRFMMNFFGAKFIHCPIKEVSSTISNTLERLKNEGYKPYFIEGGGHGNIGTQAYVDAFNEILDYEIETKVEFDYIFHTSGTGTTQAGLICGNQLHNSQKKIIGISNARRNPSGKNVVIKSVNSYLQSIDRLDKKVDDIDFIDDYVLDGYSSYNKEIMNTIKKILIQEGISLDPIYTGKGFWGMTEYIQKNKITNSNILFIHTGGTPLFFDKLKELNYE